jgi:Tol biopolymer transport system component
VPALSSRRRAAAVGFVVLFASAGLGTWWASAVIRPAGGHPPGTSVAEARPGSDPAYSPDGRFLAYASNSGADGSLLVDRSADVDKVVFQGPGFCYRPVWSPDGRLLAYLVGPPVGPSGAAACSVWIYDLSLNRTAPTSLTVLHRRSEGAGPPVRWFPDSRRLLTSGPPVAVWDLASKEVVTLSGPAAKTGAAAVSPGGRLVAWEEDDGRTVRLRVFDTLTALAREMPVRRGSSQNGKASAPEWVTEDSLLVLTERPDGSTGIDALSVSTGRRQELIRSAAFAVVSPDLRRVAFGAPEGGGRNGVYDLGTGKTTWLSGAGVALVKWSPRGTRLLLFTRFAANVFDLASGEVVPVFSGAAIGGSPEWAPDDSHVAFTVIDAGTERIILRGVPDC